MTREDGFALATQKVRGKVVTSNGLVIYVSEASGTVAPVARSARRDPGMAQIGRPRR